MAIRDIFKLSRKTFFDPVTWIDYGFLKEQTVTIWGILRNLFTAPAPARKETFEEAKKRLNLSNKDIHTVRTNYRYYALFFLLLGVLVFLYSFYLLFHHLTFAGWLLGMVTTTLFLSQAFKYDFWAFQIKHHTLGATFTDWKNSYLGAKRSK